MLKNAIRSASITAGVRIRRTPKSLTDFVLSSDLIRPSQVPSELHRLAEIIGEIRPERALEIGTFKGGTLCLLARLSSASASIISVDLPGGEFGGGYSKIRSALYHSFSKFFQHIRLIRGNSHSDQVLKEVSKDKPLDYIFIDGDHSYEGVKKDFIMYSPLVRSGGVIAFHDIAEHPASTGCDVKRFWDEIKPSHKHEEIIESKNQGWAGIGVLYF